MLCVVLVHFISSIVSETSRKKKNGSILRGVSIFVSCEDEGGGERYAPGFARPHIVSHRDVVVRFGRFPHRNANMGRESTPEEVAWLASDEVPGWAKSQ